MPTIQMKSTKQTSDSELATDALVNIEPGSGGEFPYSEFYNFCLDAVSIDGLSLVIILILNRDLQEFTEDCGCCIQICILSLLTQCLMLEMPGLSSLYD